jgi:hypothetical protein
MIVGIIVLAIALIVLDLAALRWGADTRDARFNHL